MPEPGLAVELLERASALFEEDPAVLANGGVCRGFRSGGAWMGDLLARLRSRPVPPRDIDLRRAGLAKYGQCTLAGMAAAMLVAPFAPRLAVLAAFVAFYAVEARRAFDFPLLVDRGRRGLRARSALVRRAGGTAAVMAVILPVAATMVLGGFVGRGFWRSWLLGCAAVVIWYEDLRREPGQARPFVDLGARAPLAVRRSVMRLPLTRPCRLLYLSDLHLGSLASRSVTLELVRTTARLRPDLVLLGGDLVDRAGGLSLLRDCVSRLRVHAPVVAVAGNHDRRVGLARVRDAVVSSGGHWLADEPVDLAGLGIEAPGHPAAHARLRLLCAHDPREFESDQSDGCALVLAGHLHGGQFIAFRRGGRDFPAALFYRWNGPTFRARGRTLLVSRGCADTLPIRFRCPREALLCELVPG